jgi:hypothetical protein
MLLNFPESNEGTAIVTNYTVHKKFLGCYIIADLENDATFYNYKTKKYEKKRRIRIDGRGIHAFGKFYKRKYSEVYVKSLEDDIILTIADFTP